MAIGKQGPRPAAVLPGRLPAHWRLSACYGCAGALYPGICCGPGFGILGCVQGQHIDVALRVVRYHHPARAHTCKEAPQLPAAQGTCTPGRHAYRRSSRTQVPTCTGGH